MDSLDYGIKKFLQILIGSGIAIIIFLFGVLVEKKAGYKVIKTTQKIDPVLKITIKNDVSDTLFIYKKIELKN